MTCPITGQYSRGFATRVNGSKRPVIVEYVSQGGMLHCRDIETQQLLVIHQNCFMSTSFIPSRYREYVFQTIAPFWASAFDAFPSAIIVTPAQSPETFVRKMRESRVAKNEYHWTSSLFTDETWEELANKLLITPLKDGKVQIGPQGARENVISQSSVIKKDAIIFSFQDESTLLHFCHLVSSRVFLPKPHFVIIGLTPEQAEQLPERFDIAFTPLENNQWEVIY